LFVIHCDNSQQSLSFAAIGISTAFVCATGNFSKTRRFEFFVCCGDSVDGASAWQKQGESEPRRNPGSNSPSTSQVEPPIRSSASKQSNKSRECAKQKAHSRSANALLQLQPTHVMLSRDGDQAVSRL